MENQDWVRCSVCKEMTQKNDPCCPRAAGAALRRGDIVSHLFAPYALVDKVDGDAVTVEYWSYDHAVATVSRAQLALIGCDEEARASWLNWTRRAPQLYGYSEDMLAMVTEAAKDARLKALEEAEEKIDRMQEHAE